MRTKKLRARKFFSGALGTFTLLLVRGLPTVPWLGRPINIWWLGLILVITGGLVSVVWDDDNSFRSFYFGATWPPLLAALTRP
jgi:hypothetical protein